MGDAVVDDRGGDGVVAEDLAPSGRAVGLISVGRAYLQSAGLEKTQPGRNDVSR